MKNVKFRKIVSAALAAIMVCTMSVNALAVTAFATDGETPRDTPVIVENTTDTPQPTAVPTPEPTVVPTPEPTAEPTPQPACEYCGGWHTLADCRVKCSVHGTQHNDVRCPRHLTCSLCTQTGHNSDSCPSKCAVHGIEHLDKDCPRHSAVCGLCSEKGHETADCPQACPVHGSRHTAAACPVSTVTNNNVYIANYRVVNATGNPLAKVNPGDKVIISVSVIDERIKADEFGVASGQNTGRIHINLAQGAFSVPSAAVIDVKMRNPVNVTNSQGTGYQALSYTVTFRDVTYLGGAPAFSFGVSYTGRNGTNVDNNMPLPYPHTTLNMNVTQATDDVPAPQIILNNANYGKVAIIGEPFALVTTATNTSTNLELDNVSLKIVLPQGITLANGNSQVLIGKVGKGGTIEHTFSLIAEGVANDIKSLPVQLIYTYEAFVGGQRTQFTSQQDVSINVQQPTRFEIQNMFNDMEMFMGNESYMSASLVNKGKTTVYNVTAELVSETLTAYDVEFLGNIMPGSTANAEFDFTASQIGTSTGKLVVTYEDASGTQYTLERDFSIEVMEQPVWDEPVVDMPVMEPEQPSVPVMPVVIGAAVIAAGGFLFWKKKQKAKRLAELEDEDEDI